MATREDNRINAIKKRVLSYNPESCFALDEIRRHVRHLDELYGRDAFFEPVEIMMITRIWRAFGSPTLP